MSPASALREHEQDAIRAVLHGLEREVHVKLELGPTATPVTLLAAGGREIDSNAVARDIVEAVCALSDRVSLSIVEHNEPGPWPRTTIGPGLEYLGMPVGYELTTLVHGILEAGRAAPRRRAPAVLLAYKLALASPRVTARGIEASEFAVDADRHGVQAVPAIVVDDRYAWAGAVPEAVFVERVLAAAAG